MVIKIDFSVVSEIILIDDGGYLIKYFNSLNIPGVSIVAVEQTSAGIRHLDDIVLNFPVINVARSQAKLVLETPFIVESSLKKLFEYISPFEFVQKNILVMGRGAIGSEVINTLRDRCELMTFDLVSNEKEDLPYLLQKADVILGCSGSTSIKYSEYSNLKEGVMLASFSSSDREFEAYKFRREFSKTSVCLNSFSNNRVNLIQSGFPINFWGDRNNMCLEKIQITMSLLTSAIYQGINSFSKETGIVEIEKRCEELIISEFLNISKKIVPEFDFLESCIY